MLRDRVSLLEAKVACLMGIIPLHQKALKELVNYNCGKEGVDPIFPTEPEEEDPHLPPPSSLSHQCEN